MSDFGFTSVLYDARTVQPGMSGVGRYTLSLLTALAALPGAPPLRALFLKETLDTARHDPALKNVELIESPVSHEDHPAGDVWLRTQMKKMVRPGEVYHGPAFIIPGGRQPFARVVTVHDLFVFTHPRFFSLKFRTWMRWKICRACRFAERIIVPTETVKQQLIERSCAPAEKIHAIFEAPDTTDPVWDAASRPGGEALQKVFKETTTDGRPRLLTVGTMDPRKDIATARAACVRLAERMPVDWIWVGGPGPIPDDSSEALKTEAARRGFRAVGHIPGREIPRALEAADLYVTCSRTEGFGIPLVEAQAAGRPIVASDLPVHREVAGDAALYFPEGDAAALAELLARLLADPAGRRELGQRGRARAHLFSWHNAATQTLQAYREAQRCFERNQ